MNEDTNTPREGSHLPKPQPRHAWLFVLLGFTGGGVGALLALFFGIKNWLDARLFILSGIAIGLALAVALAPNLLTRKPREASAPKQ